MKAKATIRLKFPSKKQLETAVKALEPETRKATTARSQANLEKENGFLVLKVEARDTVALRAAVNAYLRWLGSMVEVLETLESVSQEKEEQEAYSQAT